MNSEPPIPLPPGARRSISRCNLPAVILGSLTFQHHPAPLALDGVAETHAELFRHLETLSDAADRAQRFMDYMVVQFRLAALEDAGLNRQSPRHRGKANYLRMLRGWSFDADGREGAVLKGWVESRFGLLPRYHGGPIHDFSGAAYQSYVAARAAGLYATNALEAQLDLVYTYCQYELAHQPLPATHLRLYRGVNRLDDYEVLATIDRRERVVLLNNLNSFTANRERADEFGDYLLEADVPVAKVFCYTRLLPEMLKGEDEYLIIGGLYRVRLSLL
jgi:NAD+--dinitrogen-reductase ADP-D-ribosyltransferase